MCVASGKGRCTVPRASRAPQKTGGGLLEPILLPRLRQGRTSVEPLQVVQEVGMRGRERVGVPRWWWAVHSGCIGRPMACVHANIFGTSTSTSTTVNGSQKVVNLGVCGVARSSYRRFFRGFF